MPRNPILLDILRVFYYVTLHPAVREGWGDGRYILALRGARREHLPVEWCPLPYESYGSTDELFPPVTLTQGLAWAAWRTFLSLCRPDDQVYTQIFKWVEEEDTWTYRLIIHRGEHYHVCPLMTRARGDQEGASVSMEWDSGDSDSRLLEWGDPLAPYAMAVLRSEEELYFSPNQLASRLANPFGPVIIPMDVVGAEDLVPTGWYVRGAAWWEPMHLLRRGDRLHLTREAAHVGDRAVYRDYLHIRRGEGEAARILTFPVGYSSHPLT